MLQAIIRALCAHALADHFRNAFSKDHYNTHYYDSSSFDEIVSDLKRWEVDDAFNRSALYNGDRKEAISKYLYHPLNPFWLLPDGALRTIHYTSSIELGWTEGDLNAVERNLDLRNMQSETMHDVVYFGRNRKLSGEYVSCRLTCSYEKRVEWYSFTGEAAISGLEYVLQHGFWPSIITRDFPSWKGMSYADLIPMKQDVGVLFYNLLE